MTKRNFDICLAVPLLFFALPLLFMALLLVLLETRTSPIFRQTRVGKDKQEFSIFKLRTMYAGTANLPSHNVCAQQICRSGKLFRYLKIDELPQLINVLEGSMSFVGPRPCLPTQTSLIIHRDKRGVNAMVPGITGVSQIVGLDMSEPERLAEMDATYGGDWSMVRDWKIILQTVTGKGRGDAVRV